MPAIPLVSRPAARVGVFLGEVNSSKNDFNLLLPAGPAKFCGDGRLIIAPAKAYLPPVCM